MMIKVEAYVREDKFEDVKAALNAIGVNGLTVSQVMGCGILLMRFVMLKRFVRKKLDMMRFRQQNNKNNNKGLSENR